MDNKAEIAFKVNLNSLKRQDSYVIDIVERATHIVLYQFQQGDWNKMNVEGSLFIVKRATPPYFGLVVLNRLGTENYVTYFTEIAKHEVHPSFLVYRMMNGDTFGFWFHNVEELDRISRLFNAYCRVPVSILPQVDETKQVEMALRDMMKLNSGHQQQQLMFPPAPSNASSASMLMMSQHQPTHHLQRHLMQQQQQQQHHHHHHQQQQQSNASQNMMYNGANGVPLVIPGSIPTSPVGVQYLSNSATTSPQMNAGNLLQSMFGCNTQLTSTLPPSAVNDLSSFNILHMFGSGGNGELQQKPAVNHHHQQQHQMSSGNNSSQRLNAVKDLENSLKRILLTPRH